MTRWWTSLLAYQGAWLTCVLTAGAGRDLPWAPLAAGMAVALHLALSPDRARQLLVILATLTLGLAAESLLSFSQTVWYFGVGVGLAPPVWIACLWAAFGTTLDVVFRPLQPRPLLAASVGAVFGPLAYLAAARAQALSLAAPTWQSLAIVAGVWALLLPLLLTTAGALRRRRATAGATGPTAAEAHA